MQARSNSGGGCEQLREAGDPVDLMPESTERAAGGTCRYASWGLAAQQLPSLEGGVRRELRAVKGTSGA